jgi:hypothetical protein
MASKRPSRGYLEGPNRRGRKAQSLRQKRPAGVQGSRLRGINKETSVLCAARISLKREARQSNQPLPEI